MTNPRLLPAAPSDGSPWDQALYAFLVEKGNRSGSRRTVEGCGTMLWPFFADLGTTPDHSQGLVTANPCDALQRPRTIPAPARGFSADDVRRLLATLPDTVRGRRDRALLLTFLLTGRRRAEVIGLKAGDITVEDGVAFYAYRGKGGKRGRRELPRPAYEAIVAALADAGKDLATMAPDESLWPLSGGTFYGRFRRYLAAAGLAPTGR